jgi:hypothetical protein
MTDRQSVIELIFAAFGSTPYPGDDYLQGSAEGCEPFDEVGPFQGRQDWRSLEAAFLDAQYSALSFFSEAGFRFFLPAFLVADLRGELETADPEFHLTHGFSDFTVDHARGERIFQIKSGKSQLINPRRYGAATFYDYARYRLSVFSREEAQAIVAYLNFLLDNAETDFDRTRLSAALEGFWLERARTAPAAAELQSHLRREQEYLDTLGHDEGDA